MRQRKQTVTRHQILKRLVHESDLTYNQASKVYETFCQIFGDAVVSGDRISIGRVMAITPTWSQPRKTHMGFKRTGNTCQKLSRTYYLGRRIKFKVSLYPEFIRTHHLKWFEADPTQ